LKATDDETAALTIGIFVVIARTAATTDRAAGRGNNGYLTADEVGRESR
jgi:hypothetical protein